MNVFSSIWGFTKGHWQWIMLVAVIAVGYGWIRHLQAAHADAISQMNASHQVEIDKITQDHAIEQQQHDQELRQLQDSVAKIQADYDAAQKLLQQQTTQEEQSIVKKYGNDADGLANLLAQKYGFTVVRPAAQ